MGIYINTHLPLSHVKLPGVGIYGCLCDKANGVSKVPGHKHAEVNNPRDGSHKKPPDWAESTDLPLILVVSSAR